MAAAARPGGGLHRLLRSLAELTGFRIEAVDHPYCLLAHYSFRGAASVAGGSSALQESAAATTTTTSLCTDDLVFLPSTALMPYAPQVLAARTPHPKICAVALVGGAAYAVDEFGIHLQPPHRQIYGASMVTCSPGIAFSVQGSASPLFVRYSFASPRASLAMVRSAPRRICFGFPHSPSFFRGPSGGEVRTVPVVIRSGSLHSRQYSTRSSGDESPDCKYDEEVILNRLDKVGTKLNQVDAKVCQVCSRVDDVDLRLEQNIKECKKIAQDIKEMKEERAASGDWTSVKIKGKTLNILSVGQFLWDAARWIFKT